MKYLDDPTVKEAIIAELVVTYHDQTREEIVEFVEECWPDDALVAAYVRALGKCSKFDYHILESGYIINLRYQVLEAMMAGWKPLGPPSHTGQNYIQGMIKEN